MKSNDTDDMASSPTRDSLANIPHLPPPTSILAPPSPGTHRSLRKLKSAHNLGSHSPRAPNMPSLITQQRLQQQHQQLNNRAPSPSRKSHPHGTLLTRSNTDAVPPILNYTNSGSVASRRAAGKKIMPGESLSLERLIRDGPPDGDLAAGLELVRLKILDQGIKSDADGMSSLRIYVWLMLLHAPVLETDEYLALIHRGASPAYSKIRNDTFRTLTTDPLFRRRVSEASIIRLLNAVAWKLHDANEERASLGNSMISPAMITHTSNGAGSPELRMSQPAMRSSTRARASTMTTEDSDAGSSEPAVYVQGMNVLAAPFLYAARSEAEAFVLFHRIVTIECPGYIRGAMDGVHRGLELVDKVLAIVDPKLSFYLISKGMSAKVYGFASVLTLCACTPPLPEVLKLWDFLFAYGAHNNILCIVAQLVIARNKILNSPSPTKVLRSFPPLQAQTIMEVTLTIIKKMPDDVYAEIVAHAK